MPHATRDGLSLYYERAGVGARDFVFVHGWCCDHSFFQPQFDHFARSASVTTLDLRGCGASDRSDDGYAVATLASDVAGLCAALHLDKPILVGHSLGGAIAVELAATAPSLVSAVVAVDPGPIDPLPQSRSALTALAERLESPDGDDPRLEYVAGLFLPTDDAERRRRTVETMSSVPRGIAAASLRGLLDWDGVSALRRCDVPLLVLLASTGGSNDPPRLRRLRPDVHIGVTVGAGHFNHLDAAGQVNAMIERFVDVALEPFRR